MAATPSPKSGAFVGGLLGLPAGLILGTLLSSGSNKKDVKGKILGGSLFVGGAAGAVVGAGGDCGCPTPTSPRTGAFTGAVLGLPAGVLIATLLTSGSKNKAGKGKILLGSLAIATVAGAVIGTGISCNSCAVPPPTPTPTPPPVVPPTSLPQVPS
jgi:hypothetical protein